MTVAAILSIKGHDVVTAPASADVTEALSALAKHNIGALVVVDSAGRIVGIVSERDLVRALASGGAEVLQSSIAAVMTRSHCDSSRRTSPAIHTAARDASALG